MAGAKMTKLDVLLEHLQIKCNSFERHGMCKKLEDMNRINGDCYVTCGGSIADCEIEEQLNQESVRLA